MAAGLLALLAPSVRAEEMSAADRAKVVQYLTTTRDQVLAEADTLTDAQWAFKAAPDRWSVGEVVEHLALAESFLFDIHQKIVAGPAATPEQLAKAKGQDDVVMKVIADRTKKVQAPEPLQPATRMGERAQVMAAFRDRRATTLAYAEKTTNDLRGRVADSPIGPLDAYQWLLFVGAHTERHLAQLREVKAHAQFPK
jgi:hypothetical protein